MTFRTMWMLVLVVAGVKAAVFAPDEAVAMLQEAKDSPCSDTEDVSRERCLSKAAKCMFLELESKNLCLPCEFGGVNIPCAPIGSVFAMKKVKNCEMVCSHQQVITKVSACTDVGGFITQDTCFAKGISALTTCMWTAYKDKDEKDKSVCGPCKVDGIGTIPAFLPGNLGPEGGSVVTASVSMCDSPVTDFNVPCDGGLGIPAVTNCHPTPPPPPPPMAPLPMDFYRIQTDENAPHYYAVPVPPPYGPREYTEASAVAARAAGWPSPGAALPPDAPVMVYGPPPPEGPTLPPSMKMMYGPPPPGIPGIPPPGYGLGTAPPPENVEASRKQRGLSAAFLAVSKTKS